MAAKRHSSNASSLNNLKTGNNPTKAVSKEKLTSKEQFVISLASQPLKDGERILWIKLGHDKFIYVDATDLNNIKGWHTKGKGRNRKITRSVGKDVFGFIHEWAKTNDGGVFMLYNRPDEFPLAECVTSSDDIGIEIDHLNPDEQLALYRQFAEVTGIEFALMLSSGGSSIHAHIKTNDFLPVEQIQYFQRLAVIDFQSDPVTTRPHQPMRVPGFYRREKEAYQELISHSDKRYSYEELIDAFRQMFEFMGWEFPETIPDDWWREEFQPIYKSGSEYDKDGKIAATAAILAEGHESWSKRKQSDREAKQQERERKRQLLNGTFTGKLIDAVNTVNALATPEDFDGVDWQFSESGHARGQCPFHTGKSGNSAWLSDRGGVWKLHCTSCTDDDPRDLFEYKLAKAGKIDISNPKMPKGQKWKDEAEAFLEAQGFERNPPTEDKISFEDDPQSVEELNTLISEGNASPPQLFTEQLSKPLANLASSLGLPVEAFIVGILPIVASRLKAGTQLAIDPVTDYYAKPILWAGLVGESGTLKTPILQSLIKPLEAIQKEEFDSFKAMKALYELEEQEWNLLTKNEKKGNPKPTPPVVKDIYFSDFTIEAIADSNSKYPDEGYLVHTDELAAYFKSMDAYRNGKGSDRQRWLTLYNGGALKVNRKTSDPIFLHQTSISIVGGIQPSVLEKQVLQDSTSEDGLWARFIWARLPMTTPPGISDRPRINISPLLEGLYRDLNKIEAMTYHLSADAKPLWNQWNSKIGQLIQQEPSGILRASYPKLKEIAARIALIVHIANSTMDKSPSGDAISGDILNDAIHFTKWLMGQTRMLYCEIGTSNNPQAARILKFVNRYKGCDWVDARTVTQWSGRPRPKAPEAREFMAQLVALGYARGNDEPVDSPKFKIQIPEISQQANKIYKSLSE